MEAHHDADIKLRLYPDQERFRAEERRRFELLDAHWDVPLASCRSPRSERARRGDRSGEGATAPATRPGARLLRPGHSVMWRINREAVLLGAGPAALLLQMAHPLVAEGVAQHSDFQGDPFGRLRRTLRDHGPGVRRRPHGRAGGPAAERCSRHGARSDRRRGCATTGAGSYRALDPELLLWVQVTLIVTSVRRVPALGRAAHRRRGATRSGRRPARSGPPGHPAPDEPGRLAGAARLLGADAGPGRTDPGHPDRRGAWRR